MMSDEMVRKSFAWLARQPEVMRLEVFRLAMKLRREHLNWLRARPDAEAKNSPEIEQQSLVWAIAQMRNNRLKASDALDEIAAARSAAAKSISRKRSPKKDLILTLLPQIRQLQEKGLTFGDIAKELSRTTRKNISPSYLHKIIAE
jgi:hypothetical protein